MHDFSGKVALVTGGSSGLGRAVALAFARAGARVVIAAREAGRGREAAEEIGGAGGQALFVPADVANAGEVARLFEAAVIRFGRVDCAFNNAAGRDGTLRAFHETSEEEFDRAVAVNLKGVWLCMRQEIRQMLQQDPPGGAIVNTSSINGLGGAPFAAPYSATKAGVLGLSKSAALEYARRGIRVNALAAGAFRTPMLEDCIDRMAGGEPEGRKAVEAEYLRLIALGRIGDPAEAAAAVLWLCSAEASYVTGHTMIVDGGLSASMR
jgi:NAD(P)-dependent dehydrogenase (short-subunit alcohol dehydrogenase family)